MGGQASGLTAGLGVDVRGATAPSTGPLAHCAPAATWGSLAVMFLDVLVRGLTGVAVGTLALQAASLSPVAPGSGFLVCVLVGPSCLCSVPGEEGRELVFLGFVSIVTVGPVQKGFGGSLSSLCWTRLCPHCD